MAEPVLASPLYCALTICQSICTITVESFFEKLRAQNIRFSSSSSGIGAQDILQGIAVLLAATLVQSFAAYVLSRRKKSTAGLVVTECFAWTIVLLSWYMPTTPLKFFYGLLFFAAGLSIHARVCAYLLDKKKNNKLSVEEMEAQGSFADRFFHELMNTFYFNLLHRIRAFQHVRFPSISRILYGSVVLVLMDVCTYIIREWIPDPAHVSPANQSLAAAIVGGVWALYSMDMFYLMGVSQFDLFGAPLPLEMKHRHPLLSESLTEFWGVRWNPIIGKLLQDSFYKPLRRIGASRVACVIACFTGSAVLHAVPQYITTQSLSDTGMMFAFFFLQGLCLMLELVVQRALGYVTVRTPAVQPIVTPKARKTTKRGAAPHDEYSKSSDTAAAGSPTKHIESKEASSPTGSTGSTSSTTVAKKQSEAVAYSIRCKNAPHQFPAELLVVGFVLSTTYVVLESRPGAQTQWTDAQWQRWVGGAASCYIGAATMFLMIRHHIRNCPSRVHKGERGAAVGSNSVAEQHVARAGQQDDGQASEHKSVKHVVLRAVQYLSFSGSLLSLASWTWAVVSMVALLPLFSIPVLHAVEPLYRQSFFVGALVRAVQEILVPKLQQCF